MKQLFLLLTVALPFFVAAQATVKKGASDTLTYYASYEKEKAMLEEQLFYNLAGTRVNYTPELAGKMPGSGPANIQLAKLANHKQPGTAILLQVDSSDAFSITVQALAEEKAKAPDTKKDGQKALLYNIASLFWNNNGLAGKNSVTRSKTQLDVGSVMGLLENKKVNEKKKTATLNWILLDTVLKVNGTNNMGFACIRERGKMELLQQNIQIDKKGFLLIYLGNDADVPSYFDNLIIRHIKQNSSSKLSTGFIITEDALNITTENVINLIIEN